MKKFIRSKVVAIMSVFVALFGITLAVAPAASAGAMCDGHWYNGGSTWAKSCYFAGGSNADYGQIVDTKTDGYCVEVQYNLSDGTGWHRVPNSLSCTTGAITTFYANHLTTGWWLRAYRTGSGNYYTIRNCNTGYRCYAVS